MHQSKKFLPISRPQRAKVPHEMNAGRFRSQGSKNISIPEIGAWNCSPSSPEQPPPECCSSLVGYKDRYLIAYGGGVNGMVYDHVYVYDIHTALWKYIETTNRDIGQARILHSATVYGDKMYVYGGADITAVLSNFVELDLVTWTWTKVCDDLRWDGHASFPEARHMHTAVIYKDRLYILMGHPCPVGKEMCYYDFHSASWHVVPQKQLFGKPPYTLHGHSAVVSGDSMFVFGGRSTPELHSYSNTLYEFNLVTERWREVEVPSNTPRPPPRYSSVLAKTGSLLLVYGGDAFGATVYFDDVWTLDLERLDSGWYDATAMTGRLRPSARSGFASATAQGALWIFGGESGSTVDTCYSKALFSLPFLIQCNQPLSEIMARWLARECSLSEIECYLHYTTGSVKASLLRYAPVGEPDIPALADL